MILQAPRRLNFIIINNISMDDVSIIVKLPTTTTTGHACTSCHAPFSSNYNLQRHRMLGRCKGSATTTTTTTITTIDNDENESGVAGTEQCNICCRQIAIRFMREHHRRVHQRNVEKHCPDCKSDFSRNYNLQQHLSRGRCKGRRGPVARTVYSELAG
jgi:hypothetical protein